MTGNEPARSSLDSNEPLDTAFDENELAQMAATDADWMRLRLTQDAFIRVRDDLIRRLGVRAQDLTWLSRAIERTTWPHGGANLHRLNSS